MYGILRSQEVIFSHVSIVCLYKVIQTVQFLYDHDWKSINSEPLFMDFQSWSYKNWTVLNNFVETYNRNMAKYYFLTP